MRYLNKKQKFYLLAVFAVLASLLTPTFVFAAVSTIQQLIGVFGIILATLGPVIIGLALIYFFWGVAQFILHAGDEAKRSEGRQIMIWGIIALFVIVSVWGLVAVLNQTFIARGVAPNAPGLPSLPGSGGGTQPDPCVINPAFCNQTN